MKTKRPTILIIISLLLIFSVLLSWGITLIKIREGDPGLAILVAVSVIGGVLSVIAAAGVFFVKRWGLWLAGILSASSIFTSLSAIALWDGLPKGLCIVGAFLDVLVFVLVLASMSQTYAVEQVRKVS